MYDPPGSTITALPVACPGCGSTIDNVGISSQLSPFCCGASPGHKRIVEMPRYGSAAVVSVHVADAVLFAPPGACAHTLADASANPTTKTGNFKEDSPPTRR